MYFALAITQNAVECRSILRCHLLSARWLSPALSKMALKNRCSDGLRSLIFYRCNYVQSGIPILTAEAAHKYLLCNEYSRCIMVFAILPSKPLTKSNFPASFLVFMYLNGNLSYTIILSSLLIPST